MFKSTLVAISLLALAGASTNLVESSAQAAPLPRLAAPDLLQANIEPVGTWVYVPDRHGKRYKAKRKGYGYRYGGYWYAEPWWRYINDWVYAPKYGKRYRHRYPGYGYYYGGYWYPRPWWRPGITLCIGC